MGGKTEKDSRIWCLFAHRWLLEGDLLLGCGVIGVFKVKSFDLELVQHCGIIHGKLVKDMAVCYLIEVIEGRELAAFEDIVEDQPVLKVELSFAGGVRNGECGCL